MLDKKYIIWIRTTKTGGTSLKAYLADSDKRWSDNNEELKVLNKLGMNGYYNEFLTPSNNMKNGLREGYVNIINQIRINGFIKNFKQSWRDSFSFIMVRNPYDRFLSGWKFLQKDKNVGELFDVSFKDMDKFDYDQLTKHYKNHIIDPIYFPGIAGVDYVIKYESYMEDIEKLLKMINIPFDKSRYPHVRKTPHRNYMEYYENNPNMINFVNNKFKADFEFFGYDKISI